MIAPAQDLSISLLKKVSRTFALTIPILPEPLRLPVATSYLLCRIADNIEDHPEMEDERRVLLFDQLLAGITGKSADFFWPGGPGNDLAVRFPAILHDFRSLPTGFQEPISDCIREMVAGMKISTLERIPDSVCRSLPELEEYCHWVAGTVGVMLDRIFTRFIGATPDENRQETARRFGLGLQLTNILQDRKVDADRGVRFLPPGNLEPIFHHAFTRLEEGHEYALSLPVDQEGLRLFCLWALWMAVATLEEVMLSGEKRPKISREMVEEILAFTKEHVRENDELFGRFRADLERARRRLTTSEVVR